MLLVAVFLCCESSKRLLAICIGPLRPRRYSGNCKGKLTARCWSIIPAASSAGGPTSTTDLLWISRPAGILTMLEGRYVIFDFRWWWRDRLPVQGHSRLQAVPQYQEVARTHNANIRHHPEMVSQSGRSPQSSVRCTTGTSSVS